MKEEKKLSIKKLIIILILILALIVLWARFINTKGLKVNEYAIINESLPESFNGLKIVHFSDIQYGQTTNIKDLKKLVKNINKLKPDVVIFTGDLFNKNIKAPNKEINNIEKELSRIEATLYKYAISGDSDLSNYNTYKDIMEKSEFIFLNNSNELLFYKSEKPIKIVGISDLKEIETAFKEEKAEQSFTIALLHEPDNIDFLNDYRTDMVFAGHSLGGQIKLPFLGGLIRKNGSEKYIDEYYKLNNTEFYISSGVGTENIKFRTFNKPSINLYRLYNK